MGSKNPFPQAISDLMNEIEEAVKSNSVEQLLNFMQSTFPDHAPNFPSTMWQTFITNPYIKLWKTATHDSEKERWDCLLGYANKACLECELNVIDFDYFD